MLESLPLGIYGTYAVLQDFDVYTSNYNCTPTDVSPKMSFLMFSIGTFSCTAAAIVRLNLNTNNT